MNGAWLFGEEEFDVPVAIDTKERIGGSQKAAKALFRFHTHWRIELSVGLEVENEGAGRKVGWRTTRLGDFVERLDVDHLGLL